MSSDLKAEFPPLLPWGFHRKSLGEVRELCVETDMFHQSVTRRSIFDGLIDVVRELNAAGIAGELWIDGSFVTEQIDPEDVDTLLHAHSDEYDNDSAKRDVIDWASNAELRESHLCDSYNWIEYNEGHPLFAQSEQDRIYWQGKYGVSLRGVPKGIIVVQLPAAMP